MQHGTTTLLEAHLTDPEELRAYAELLHDERLPLRIFYTFEIDARQSLADIERYLGTLRFAADGGFGTPRLKVVGVSIGLDGPYWHGAACHDAPNCRSNVTFQFCTRGELMSGSILP